MMALLTDPSAWLALVTLSALEIVLGVDNIIFISILVGRLPEARRERARIVGLGLAMLTRIALLFSIVGLTRLTQPWFTVFGEELSGRDLILIAGGLFLIAKSVTEVHGTLEGAEDQRRARAFANFTVIVVQMAIIIAILVMMMVSRSISEFVDRHPTIKVLALSFLVLVGVALVADGLGTHIPKGYLYFAMAFSVCVEMVNLRLRKLLDRRRSG